MNTYDTDMVIQIKLNRFGLHLHELEDGNNSEIYKAYEDAGGMTIPRVRDTHYVMDNALVVFVGSKQELLEFVTHNF
jgi:hypothetical protein